MNSVPAMDSYFASSKARRTSFVDAKKPSPAPAPALHTRGSSISAAAKSPFSWFSAVKPASEPILQGTDDDLVNFDIERALFPNGPTDPQPTPSFNELLGNAEATILHLHSTYLRKTRLMQEVNTQHSVQQDELEQVKARSRHLKSQLEDMAAKVADQERAMRTLADELATERMRRAEDEESRSREQGNGNPFRENFSDSGFESDADSRSPSAYSMSQDDIIMSAMNRAMQQSSHFTSAVSYFGNQSSSPSSARRVPSGRAPVTAQKLLDPGFDDGQSKWRCIQCNSSNRTSSSSTLDGLQKENKQLKERVEELEGTVEGCLDLVGRIEI